MAKQVNLVDEVIEQGKRFRILLQAWGEFCEKHFKVHRNKKQELDPDKHRAFVARLSDEWRAIRTQLSFTGKEEAEGYKAFSAVMREHYNAVINSARYDTDNR